MSSDKHLKSVFLDAFQREFDQEVWRRKIDEFRRGYENGDCIPLNLQSSTRGGFDSFPFAQLHISSVSKAAAVIRETRYVKCGDNTVHEYFGAFTP